VSPWRQLKIGDILGLEYGKALQGYGHTKGQYEVFGTNGKIGTTDIFLYNKPSLVIGRKGAYRGVHLAKSPFFVIDTAFYTKNKAEDLDVIFMYYWFQCIDINSMDSGSAIPSTSRDEVYNLDISLPSPEEQKAIASVLTSLDDKIDLLHRQNKTLEAMAETLFRQWFVEDKTLRMGNLSCLIDCTLSGDWGKEFPEDDSIVHVNCIRGTDIADLQNGLAKKTPLRYVNERKLQTIEPKNGDIIFEISGGTENQSTGRATYINDGVSSLFSYPLVFSNFCRLFRPKKPTQSYFLYAYLTHLYKQDEFFGLENGSSGIKNLNYKALLYEQVSPFFDRINQGKHQIQTLEHLRDTLLPKLMAGEVRVAY
jgi:type I restriction enzyme S subunit